MISSAAFFSSTPPISTSSSTARSARSSRVRTPLRASALAKISPASSTRSARRLRAVHRFLARDGLRQQHVARARTQLLDDLLVELLDPVQFARRHVGDLLDGREPLLHQDARHVGVHVELLHEGLAQRERLGLALRLRLRLAHHVQLPAGELARQADVLAAAADGLRKLVLGDRDIHRVRILVHHDRGDLGRRHGVDDELRVVVVERE